MTEDRLGNSRIVAAYKEKTQTSARLAARAHALFPSGVTHDSRHLAPHMIAVDRARGGRKWDADGNAYVDYIGGHGALILGHGHPRVMQAVHAELDRMTHPGAGHELEVRWGRLVQRLVPAAERVRFVGSGTEATMMAMRLARAFTGKPGVVRFPRHFHGWNDHVAFGQRGHFDGTPTPGVLKAIADNVILAPSGDIGAVRRIFETRDDIAAVMLEPTGVWAGFVPLRRTFVEDLVGVARDAGVLVIFDEVVTGFRVSPGGAQAAFGLKPDLTTLAKILSGGLPGGAVCGRKDILDLLDFDEAEALGIEKIGHQGTFNANPLSASAGIAALEIIAEGDACEAATRKTERVRHLMNGVLSEEGVPWAVYGDHSAFFVFTNPEKRDVDPLAFDAYALDPEAFTAPVDPTLMTKLVLALLVNGADLSTRPGGLMSAAHTDTDLEETAAALRAAVKMLKEEGEI